MDPRHYNELKIKLIRAGYGAEIQEFRDIKPCDNPFDFWMEYSWVVISSGIKNQVARIIWNRVLLAMTEGKPIYPGAFRHKGKAEAIETMWQAKETTFVEEYLKAKDKIGYLETLSWIGGITKYHLAKNLGLPVCKPDRHLTRIAKQYGMTPVEMCERLSRETGDSIAVIDSVIWRAANLRMV
jgi:hypothetical protein